MRLVALTGGIGSGKSTVSGKLAERGALLIDADAIVRDLQRPGQEVLAAMVERWGESILHPDGSLDRAAVAKIVFSDEAEREAIEAIVHPAVAKEMKNQMWEASETDGVVLLDIPLLAEGAVKNNGIPDLRGASAVIVVDCRTSKAVERLITHRGFDRADAEKRVEAQVSRRDRLELADFVVDNSGTLADLALEVERCWAWLETLDQTPWPPPDESPDR